MANVNASNSIVTTGDVLPFPATTPLPAKTDQPQLPPMTGNGATANIKMILIRYQNRLKDLQSRVRHSIDLASFLSRVPNIGDFQELKDFVEKELDFALDSYSRELEHYKALVVFYDALDKKLVKE